MAQPRKHRAKRGPCSGTAATPVPREGGSVVIDSLTWGGDGVGRAGGKVTFIPFTAPGDIADITVTADRRNYSRGRLRKLLRESPQRVSPPCPLFGDCGGCQWQHLSPEAQLEAKRIILADALTRIGRIAAPRAAAVVPSPLDFGYRHRTRLQVDGTQAAPTVGFFRGASHTVVPVKRCLILQESLNLLLPAVAELLAGHPRFLPAAASVSLTADFSGTLIRAAFRAGGKSIAPPQRLARSLSAHAERHGLEIFFAGGRERPLALGPDRVDLFATDGAFTQVNLAHNRNLVNAVVSLASPAEGETALDLYCGMGNFSIPMALRGARVLGVDTNGPSIRCAGANARRLGLPVELRRAAAESAVVGLAARGKRFDLVVLNPPRSGAKETAAELHALAPSRIVMVSCDPATFARDAATIISHGYRLSSLRAFDLFPQTFHFETVGLFTRS